MQDDFHGAKLAIVVGDRILTLLRDARRDIPWPDHWDLPGGGRDPGETPDQTALRELHEELGLTLDPARIRHRQVYGRVQKVWFLGAYWPDLDPADVVFGDEGQGWELMPIPHFLAHPRTVPMFKQRLRRFIRDVPENPQGTGNN